MTSYNPDQFRAMVVLIKKLRARLGEDMMLESMHQGCIGIGLKNGSNLPECWSVENLIRHLVTQDDINEIPLPCGWCGSPSTKPHKGMGMQQLKCSNFDCPISHGQTMSVEHWNKRGGMTDELT